MNELLLENIVGLAIEEYNKYRSLEVVAKLLSMNRKSFKVEFSGSFCYTCEFYDYFDNFKYTLEDFGLKTEIAKIIEKDNGAVVNFKIIDMVVL